MVFLRYVFLGQQEIQAFLVHFIEIFHGSVQGFPSPRIHVFVFLEDLGYFLLLHAGIVFSGDFQTQILPFLPYQTISNVGESSVGVITHFN